MPAVAPGEGGGGTPSVGRTQPAEADPGPTGPEPESGIGAALEDISLSRIGTMISEDWLKILFSTVILTRLLN